MIPFLKQVASAYYRRGAIENTCFIFPNRRSEVFFLKYLSGTVAEAGKQEAGTRPLLVPWLYTINDFIYKLYDMQPAGRIPLLLELYKVYSGIFDKAELLDDFIFWGDMIIGDFNDVDKYLADASQLYANISDLKDIRDSFSYLSDRQREAIESFVSHFSDKAGRLTVDLGSDNPKVKEKFLQIWNILGPLYSAYREALAAKGMAYEGMVYRGVAERFADGSPEELLARAFPGAGRFVFVGLNALNECEKTVMRRMRDASLAEFCWDYSGDMIRDPYNKSSFFMEENVREFPEAFPLDTDGLPEPVFRVASVPSAAGQAKLLPHIFREIADGYTGGDLSKVGVLGREGGSGYADCAVVLPDESLLMTVLNTIPPEIRDINVTMGYPMASSSFFLFMDTVVDVQMNVRKKGGALYFYHKPVYTLFSDPVFRLASGKDGERLADAVKSEARSYISCETLDAGGLLSTIFRPVVTDLSTAGKEETDRLCSYLLEVVEAVVPSLKRKAVDRVEAEFAMEFHKTLNSLRGMHLDVKPRTFVRILEQIVSPVSVPFKGEPLQGLQIMGPLETRALDFDNIVILSANEGVFPRRNVSSSFIPPELRKGFGLPTYEYQDAVWAYYFYRMISRASNVWLVYDSRTEGLKSGEESRYIKQLQYHFEVPVERRIVSASLSRSDTVSEIPKTAEDAEAVRKMVFSASSLQEYLACPASFYYGRIRNLGKPDDVVEVLDAGIFGTVFHEMMQALYLGEEAMASDLPVKDWVRQAPSDIVPREISQDYISSWLKRGKELKSKVRKLIMREMHTLEITGRNLVVTDVIVRYVMKTLSVDLAQLKSCGRQSFRIFGLEKNFTIDFEGFMIKGFIDRIDSMDGRSVRVVDYKTGKVKPADVGAAGSRAAGVADAVFGENNLRRPKIALQLYVYDKFMAESPMFSGMPVENCIYSTRELFSGIPESYPVDPTFVQAMDERLSALFRQMTDLSVPFRLTDDVSVCKYCDFKNICGR